MKASVPHITLLRIHQKPELPCLYKQRNMIKIGKFAQRLGKSLRKPPGIPFLLWFLHQSTEGQRSSGSER